MSQADWLRLLDDDVVEAVAREEHTNFDRYGQTKRLAAMWDAKGNLQTVVAALIAVDEARSSDAARSADG